MQLEIPPEIGVAVLLGVSGAGLLLGGLEERLVAAGLFANVAASALLRSHVGRELQWAGFVADLLLLVLLLGIALRSAKFWPLAAAAFQLLAVLTHIAMLVDRNVNRWAYLTAIVIWTYALIAALGVGIWNSWRSRPHRTDATGGAATRL